MTESQVLNRWRWNDTNNLGDNSVSNSYGIDIAKGILMILVIFGHSFSGHKEDNLGRWVLYGFHMPAFLYISGYLIRGEKLLAISYRTLMESYAKRLLLPWLIATGLFLVLKSSPLEMIASGEWNALLSQVFLMPYLHLWYIPALVVGISLLWLFSRIDVSPVVGILISLFFYFLFTNVVRAGLQIDFLDSFNKRYLGYFIFLYLGFVVRNSNLKFENFLAGSVVASFGLGIYILGFRNLGWYSPIGFLIFNLGLVAIYPATLSWFSDFSSKVFLPIASAGKNSLWLYLLHPVITVWFIHATAGDWYQRISGIMLATALTIAFGSYMIWYRNFSARSSSK